MDQDDTVTLAQPINQADRVTLTISNAGIASYTPRLDVLPGDVNDDGVVSIQDAYYERNAFLGFGVVPYPETWLDILGDGQPDLENCNFIRSVLGTTLPPNQPPA